MFNPAAIQKLNYLLARGYSITRVEYDATVHEVDGKFPTLKIQVEKRNEIGSIDQFGRVVWLDTQHQIHWACPSCLAFNIDTEPLKVVCRKCEKRFLISEIPDDMKHQ